MVVSPAKSNELETAVPYVPTGSTKNLIPRILQDNCFGVLAATKKLNYASAGLELFDHINFTQHRSTEGASLVNRRQQIPRYNLSISTKTNSNTILRRKNSKSKVISKDIKLKRTSHSQRYAEYFKSNEDQNNKENQPIKSVDVNIIVNSIDLENTNADVSSVIPETIKVTTKQYKQTSEAPVIRRSKRTTNHPNYFEQIEVPVIRRSKRITNHPYYFKQINNRKNPKSNMSMYDYNYHQSDGTVNGVSSGININQYYGSRNHHSNSDDSYFSSDSSSRQQLHDIASSMASLCNIGNSCYMNSVIYTLRFTPLFLHNLHHLVGDVSQILNKKENQLQKLKSASLGRNVSGLQGQNARSWSSKDLVSLGSSSTTTTISPAALEIVKTTQQNASEKLHELFQNLSNNEMTETTEPYQSDLFLKAIQDVNPIFEGNQQQDAHEFLMCILDSIRESCQALTKTVTEHPEMIVNGFIGLAEPVDRPIVKPPIATPQPIVEKKIGWFGVKKKKDDKNKGMRIDSPSKEPNSTVLISGQNEGTSTTNSSVATNGIDTEHCGIANKQNVQDKIKALGLDFFSEDFEGITASSTQCLSCETLTEQKETMIDLSVPITENMETIEHTDSFIQNLCITRERFQGDNKFRCEKCMGYTEAVRQITYPKLPRLLIIQLKRFSGGMEKINSYIPTPFTLQCFCSACCSKCEKSKEHEYKLYSVITHVGATMCAGHYIAYTCSLNLNSAYVNCPKDMNRKEMQQQQQQQQQNVIAASSASTSAATASVSGQKSSANHISIVSSVTGVGLIKKISLLGIRNKTSSNNADVTKDIKNCNGVKNITNGLDNVHLANDTNSSSTISAASTTANIKNTVCPSSECCSIKMKMLPTTNNVHNNGNSNSIANGTDYQQQQQHSRNNSLSSVYSDQFGLNTNSASSNNAKINSEPIWYMCDDDKIKAIPQHEFREMLLPNKKNRITPYLLFYARNDVFAPH